MSKMTIEFNYRDDKVIGGTIQKDGIKYEEHIDENFDNKKASLLIAMKILDFSKDDINKVLDALNYKGLKIPFYSDDFETGKIVIRCKTERQYNKCISILTKYYNYDKSMMREWNSILRKYNDDDEIAPVFIDSFNKRLDWGVNDTAYVGNGQRVVDFEDIVFNFKGAETNINKRI